MALAVPAALPLPGSAQRKGMAAQVATLVSPVAVDHRAVAAQVALRELGLLEEPTQQAATGAVGVAAQVIPQVAQEVRERLVLPLRVMVMALREAVGRIVRPEAMVVAMAAIVMQQVQELMGATALAAAVAAVRRALPLLTGVAE
jgi:hypothetical protein